MNLQETNYNQFQGTFTVSQTSAIRRSMYLLSGSVAAALGVGYFLLVSGMISNGMSLFAILAVFVLSFVAPRLGDTPAGYLSVIATGALLGVAVVPSVAYYISVGATAVVLEALLSTAVIFVSLAVYATVSKRDFSFMTGFLVVALLAAVVMSLLNVFFIKSAFTSLIISYVVALVSSGLILVRISSAIRYGVTSSVELAFGLLLDVYNLFVSLLRIFGSRE